MLTSTAYAQSCRVADPTGTPLNVRASVQGKVIGKLPNRKVVHVLDYDYDSKGRTWAYVSYDSGRRSGWVFREFIACY
ncbi:hypothetical protein B0181_05760 [Moraxella caviae]|nr:hypothetical protein B0181_05760 [Moraxella caviae]